MVLGQLEEFVRLCPSVREFDRYDVKDTVMAEIDDAASKHDPPRPLPQLLENTAGLYRVVNDLLDDPLFGTVSVFFVGREMVYMYVETKDGKEQVRSAVPLDEIRWVLSTILFIHWNSGRVPPCRKRSGLDKWINTRDHGIPQISLDRGLQELTSFASSSFEDVASARWAELGYRSDMELFCVLCVNVFETAEGALALYVSDLETHIGARLFGRALPEGLGRISRDLLASVPRFLYSLNPQV